MAGPFESQLPRGEDWVARELANIRREQREQIASVAASFQSTVEDLQQAQQDLADAIAAAVDIQVDNDQQSGITVPASWTDYVPVQFTTPAGFTTCSVVAIASGVLYISEPGDFSDEGAAQMRIEIAGTAGDTFDAKWMIPGEIRPLGANFARVVTGLAEDDPVDVVVQLMHDQGSHHMDNLNVSSVAVFTR